MLQVVDEVPMDLKMVYSRMVKQIQQLKRENPELCRSVLQTVITAYRPLHLAELGVLSGLPGDISSVNELVVRIVNMCGSFLTIRDDNVYIIHQSAKDFLSTDASHNLFPFGVEDVHYTIFSRSLQVMSRKLQRNIYGLCALGFPIDQVEQPNLDPLAGANYSCIYWVDHMYGWDSSKGAKHTNDLEDGGVIDQFLR